MLSKDYWHYIFRDIISSVASAAIIGLVAVVLIEAFYSTPSLDGFWELNSTTEQTSYRKFKGLELTFHISLIQNKLTLTGSGDKYSEKLVSDKNHRSLSGKQKTNVKFRGYIEKRIFGKNRVHLSMEEDGIKRRSTIYFELDVYNDNKMEGKFFSTAANSTGIVKLNRKKFPHH